MLTVLSAGLPFNAKDILTNTMNEVFDGEIVVQELTRENLRSRVRLSNRSVEIVLVVLDRESSDICKDIEAGLYQSDKYYEYVNDKELVEFLNNRYGLEISIDESTTEEIDVPGNTLLSNKDEKYYLEKINSKEDIIFNLECRIKDLTAMYGLSDENEEILGVSNGELEELRGENTHLNSELLNTKSLLELERAKIAELENTLSSLKEGKLSLENSLKKASKESDELAVELNELKVAYSRQTGLIRDKDTRICELENNQVALESSLKENIELKEHIESIKCVISNKEIEIGNLKVDLLSKDRDLLECSKEIESLRKLEGLGDELESANKVIHSLKKDISIINSDNDNYHKELIEKDKVISQLSSSNSEYSVRVGVLEREIEELNERIKNDDKSLFQLNKEKLELQTKLGIMEKSINTDDTEALIREIDELQGRVSDMSSNIFNNIGMSASPNALINSRVFSGGSKFKNIRFAFAGSAESRKGTYKCLLEELRSCNDENRYLIVDLVSETSIDYVFKVKNMIPGLDWFKKGGSVQSYVSSTELGNTQVLSLGLGYINDSYFLCIDWVSRLAELENSGYKVILFCGDVSNLVGRVLHESFASYGESTIYVLGNAVGSRTLITNLRGLSNKRDSIIAYFDFNPAMRRFYEIVSKSNTCKILSTKSKR